MLCERITLTNPVWFIRRLNLWHLRNPNESRNCSEKQARGSWWFSIARLLCCRLLLFSKCSCVLRSITGGNVTTCIPFDAGKSLRCAICDDWDFKEQTWPYWLRYWTSMSSSARPDNVSHSIDTAVSSRDTGIQSASDTPNSPIHGIVVNHFHLKDPIKAHIVQVFAYGLICRKSFF